MLKNTANQTETGTEREKGGAQVELKQIKSCKISTFLQSIDESRWRRPKISSFSCTYQRFLLRVRVLIWIPAKPGEKEWETNRNHWDTAERKTEPTSIFGCGWSFDDLVLHALKCSARHSASCPAIWRLRAVTPGGGRVGFVLTPGMTRWGDYKRAETTNRPMGKVLNLTVLLNGLMVLTAEWRAERGGHLMLDFQKSWGICRGDERQKVRSDQEKAQHEKSFHSWQIIGYKILFKNKGNKDKKSHFKLELEWTNHVL